MVKKSLFPLIAGALILLLLALFLFPFKVRKAAAYFQTEVMCYSQCAAYKFVWHGDYCWDLFQQQCAMGKGNSIKETIKFLKTVYSVIKDCKGVDTVFKAWFVCKPLIENCINPQLRDCRTTCSQDQLAYAPDLSVGHPYAHFVYHGVIYNEKDHTLTFKVVNNGLGYAWDIETEATWGHTRNRDGQVSGGGQLFQETISELIYAGARNGPPKTLGDYVTDFLIEESNFAQYLQGFKSDADNYDVPAVWYKTIPFTAPGGELTKVIFNVDPSNLIPERSESNNTFILEIDNLPTPPSFEIDNFSQRLVDGTLNNFMIDFVVKNNGEENGQAMVKIYEGEYASPDQTPIYSSSQVVQGLNQFNFGTLITPDVSSGDTYCGQIKRYELVVFDDQGKADFHKFSLPLYSGTVRGRVEDLFGQKVEGVTITASTGQTATTNQYGSYQLKGLNSLGKVTITATHPEFSQPQTKELELKIADPTDPCAENSLTFNQVNFVLKDQDVLFNITIKDGAGNPINAHVLASNQDWRFENEINGQGPLPGMQPGRYLFTLSAPGYKTISQDVNAVPSNLNLEFTLETLNGRPTDDSLTIHEPRLLWEKNLGEEILANMSASKDGKLVVYFTTRNSVNSGKLYFVDSLTGSQRTVVSTSATIGQSQASLDCSYDGNTTALFVHAGVFGQSKGTNQILLFNNQGEALGSTELNSQKSTGLGEVSPDGFYLYPFQLLNKGLYQYTRFDIEGLENSEAPMTYSASQGFHFTTANNVVAGCPSSGGQCVLALNKNEITRLGDIEGNSRSADSSQDGSKIAIITVSKAYLFSGGTKAWEKEVTTRASPLDIAVSPGGKFVIYSSYLDPATHRSLKIFSDNNLDKTPASLPDASREDVVFVHANDKGLFFATQDQKTINYYQVGSYSVEYNPSISAPTSTPPLYVSGLTYWDNGVFRDVGPINYYQLLPYTIYRADQTVTFDLMEPYGSLRITEGALFGVDLHHHPVVLKGQITAEFNSPAHVYAIKFDRDDLNLFAQKLEQFTGGHLPADEYFEIKNIHTRFSVKNNPNEIKIMVDSGQVQVLGQKFDKIVSAHRQITIDEKNNFKESIYLGRRIYLLLVGILVIIASILLFVYRKTKIGRKIIRILKAIAKWLWVSLVKVVKIVGKVIKGRVKEKL